MSATAPGRSTPRSVKPIFLAGTPVAFAMATSQGVPPSVSNLSALGKAPNARGIDGGRVLARDHPAVRADHHLLMLQYELLFHHFGAEHNHVDVTVRAEQEVEGHVGPVHAASVSE